MFSLGGYLGEFTLFPKFGMLYKLDFVRNGSSVDFYLNSIYSQSISFTADIQPSSNFYIGIHAPGECFNGNISQVSIYNRALTATEIIQNYNAVKNRFDR